jgi:hypothetical protein
VPAVRSAPAVRSTARVRPTVRQTTTPTRRLTLRVRLRGRWVLVQLAKRVAGDHLVGIRSRWKLTCPEETDHTLPQGDRGIGEPCPISGCAPRNRIPQALERVGKMVAAGRDGLANKAKAHQCG